MVLQTTMTGFLFPPTVRVGGQSQATPPPGQGSPRIERHDPPEKPTRASKKSKKAPKQERKRERKRQRLHRACKGGKKMTQPQTPESSTPTPMPSPCELTPRATDVADQDVANGSILISDQSLTELMASTNHTEAVMTDGLDANIVGSVATHRIVRLEANLVAINLELQCKQDECVALQNQVEILMQEIDNFKRTDKNQKSEVKKLTNENDRLRKELSKHSGVRKYFDNQPAQTEPPKVQDPELYFKYGNLRSKLTEITDSLVRTLEEDFALITRKKTSAPRPNVSADKSYSTVLQNKGCTNNVNTAVTPSPVRTQDPSYTRTIPVVEIGAAARNAALTDNIVSTSPLPSDKSSRQPQQFNTTVEDTIIIGTSLVQGLGPRLHSMGINATTYMYRGADIPTVQSRIRHIIPSGSNPKCVVLQVGGNDATKQPVNRVVCRYESLIRDIQRQCPLASIILSKVPPRRGSDRTMTAITEINANIDRFADSMNNVFSVSVCPVSIAHFRKDCTHFYASGMDIYARNLTALLQNFSQLRTPGGL